MSSETITRLEAENATLRQRINELEMRLEAYNTGNATLRTTDHTDAFNEFQGFRTTVRACITGHCDRSSRRRHHLYLDC
jgi:hypothetical protein